MKQCPQCGYVISPGSNFCSACGCNLTEFDPEKQTLRLPQTPHNVAIGTVLDGRFEIISEIARGGMGLVYKARDKTLDEIVALKILKADLDDQEEMVSRFKREIKIARKIKHPNVCAIYDFSYVDEVFYISMEYIEGEDLSILLKQNRFPEQERVPLFRGLISALNAAHRENIIHRDLKPSNIMIDYQYRPIILDFGIARYIGKSDITVQDDILGTPTYMAPEQFQGRNIDQRSDIYSLGVIMYELYTGTIPFCGETPLSIALKHIKDQPKSLRDHNPTIPTMIEKIVVKCLHKDPVERYQQVNDILKDLNPTESWQRTKKNLKLSQTKVLVADSDKNIQSILDLVLKEKGFTTVTATDGEEAIMLSMHEHPALILMDLSLPKMDGYQAAEYLLSNKDTAKIPIIMLSNRNDREYRAYSKAIGVREYLTKPIDYSNLIGIIDQIGIKPGPK
ncbi:protein kinase [bacterium]|nr:protein kinase [bacterium]